ncbi:hypothetical protein WA158_001151 [Blastocystis sp. Blastoise]
MNTNNQDATTVEKSDKDINANKIMDNPVEEESLKEKNQERMNENPNNPEKHVLTKDEERDKKAIEKSKFLGDAPVYSTVLKLTYPDLISKLVNASYSFIDSIYIGQLAGATQEERTLALGSVSYAAPIETAFQMGLAMLYGSGLATVLGRYLGSKNIKMAERTLGNLYFLAILSGIIYPLVIIPLAPYILKLLGATDEAGTMQIAYPYATIIAIGSLFNNISTGHSNLMRAEGQAMYSCMVRVTGALFNIIMDPVFIKVFNLGVNGAAYCSVVGNIITNIAGFCYYFSSKSVLKPQWKNIKPKPVIIKKGLSVGMAGCLMTACTAIVSIVFNRLMIAYSPYPQDSLETTELVSVVGSLTKVALLSFLPVYAVSCGSLPILSYCKGAKLYSRFKEVLKVCLIYSLSLGIILCILFASSSPYMGKLFSSSESFNEVFKVGVLFMAFSIPFNCVFFTVLPALQASGEGILGGLLALLKNCILYIFYAWLICYIRGDYWGILYSYLYGDITTCVLSIIIYFWKKPSFYQEKQNKKVLEEHTVVNIDNIQEENI